jgi:transcriptional regulator with XRE-family HTH domain
MDLGERIAAWRKAKGLTQRQLAAIVEVTHAAVGQWESGKTSPLQEHLDAIVKHLGITMEKFYGRVPPSKAA